MQGSLFASCIDKSHKCSYIKCVKAQYKYQWDNAKAEANLARHGVAFEEVCGFDWDSCVTLVDECPRHGEIRFYSLGLVNNRLHALVWTWREGSIRVISLRKANNRERKGYDAKIVHHRGRRSP